MKVFRTILMILVNILLIPCSLLMTAGCVWYTLPELSATKLGLMLTNIVSPTILFWVIIGCAIGFIILYVLQLIFGKDLSAKFRNFFVHLGTWLMCLLAIGIAIYTFAVTTPLIAQEVMITSTRKIGIAITLGALILAIGFANKIHTIINRKIQAYDTAKEMNTIGRSSVIFVNFLKLFEIFFPEILILILLCFCVSWNVAIYFIIIVIASLIPMIGNIISDFITRQEIKRKLIAEKEANARRIADEIGR